QLLAFLEARRRRARRERTGVLAPRQTPEHRAFRPEARGERSGRKARDVAQRVQTEAAQRLLQLVGEIEREQRQPGEERSLLFRWDDSKRATAQPVAGYLERQVGRGRARGEQCQRLA